MCRCMNRRVVVTGTGVISPVGNSVESFWTNLIDGYCGIDVITSFPTDDLPVKVAGLVKDFDPSEYEIEALILNVFKRLHPFSQSRSDLTVQIRFDLIRHIR